MLQEQATLNACTCISCIICFVGLPWSHNVTSWQHSEIAGSTTKIRENDSFPVSVGTWDYRSEDQQAVSVTQNTLETDLQQKWAYKGLPLEKLRIRNSESLLLWDHFSLRPRDPESPRDALSHALLRRSTARRRKSGEWGAGPRLFSE